jgi:hypothetical protein
MMRDETLAVADIAAMSLDESEREGTDRNEAAPPAGGSAPKRPS